MKKEKKKLYTATYRFEGKRYYVRSSVSQRDADKRAAKALQEREDGSMVIGGDIRVADYALRWAETYKSTTVSKPVYNSYVSRINRIIIPAIGAMRMKDVRPTNLQEIMNQQAGKSKAHCDKLLVTIKAIFHQAYKDDIIRRDPAEDIQKPKATEGTHRSLTEEERAAVLAAAETHRFGLAAKFMLYCGLRPQEAVALKWSDIDRINHRLMVRRALKADGTIGEPKSASGKRDIPIPPMLWEALHFPDDLDEYILHTRREEKYCRSTLWSGWVSFKRAVDIALGAVTEGKHIVKSVVAPDLDMYCFRHTYCTDLEAAGVPINVAKYLMGHSSIVLTSRIYTHMRDDTLTEAATRIAQIGATTGATKELQNLSKPVQNSDEAGAEKVKRFATK